MSLLVPVSAILLGLLVIWWLLWDEVRYRRQRRKADEQAFLLRMSRDAERAIWKGYKRPAEQPVTLVPGKPGHRIVVDQVQPFAWHDEKVEE